jgi:Amt family ammonium transporter
MCGSLLLSWTVLAWAGEPGGKSINTIDTFWVLFAGFLVFFMQAGFAMVEAGLVRAKNAANIMMKNLMDFCVGTIGYFIFGYAIMFGGSGSFFGTQGWFLIHAKSPDHLPLYAFWMFQAAFCGTAATIVSGALAERIKFSSYLLYSLIISAFIYPIVGHWVWGGGWLAQINFYDFAGSTVVHTLGGFAALIGTILLKPRIGKFNGDKSPNFIAGHNMPLVTFGVFILWLGWFGFNPGSTLGLGDPELVARITINTNLAAAAGAISAMAVTWLKHKKPDMALTMNGALAGLVAITASCSVVNPISAILIGLLAGALVIWGVHLLDHVGVDDPVGAIPVHGFNGVFGTLMVGFFGQKALGAPLDGLLFGGGLTQLGIQVTGVLSVAAFITISMGVVFLVINKTIGLRVSAKEELQGLDLTEHGMESYSGFQIFITE